MKQQIFCRLLILLTVAAGVSLPCARHAVAGGKKDSSREVKVTHAASTPDAAGNQVIVLNVAVNKGWHIYANPVGNEKLKGAETVVTVNGRTKVAAVKIDYPPGTLVRDKDFGDHQVYEGTAVIRAQVQRTPGDTTPLELTVTVNACDENRCLLPGQIKVIVP